MNEPIIDYEPDPKNSQHVRNRHLTDLADTIVQALNDTPECWEIVRDADAHMKYVRLTSGAGILIARLLKENV